MKVEKKAMNRSSVDVGIEERCGIEMLWVLELWINKFRLSGEVFFSSSIFIFWKFDNSSVTLIK